MNRPPATLSAHRGPLALAIAFLIVGGSCRSRPAAPAPAPRLWLGALAIQAMPSVDRSSPPVDANAVASKIRTVLLATGLVVTPAADSGGEGAPAGSASSGGERPGGTLRINGVVGAEIVEVDKKGICRAVVSMKVATRPSDAPGAIDDQLSGTGEERFDAGGPGSPDRAALATDVAARTAGDLVRGLMARARLRHATAAELHAAIVADGGTALREEAIRQAGARHLVAEAPAMLSLLDDPEEAVRDAALGALIALRDQRAVAQLARHRSFRDKREMPKILEAISQIGGEEARQYLSFVADGHEDAEIRQQAREARDRLARREGGDPPPAQTAPK